MNTRLRQFIAGLLFSTLFFVLPISLTTAVPNKDVTIDVKVKRLSSGAVQNGNTNSALSGSNEEIKPVGGKYFVKQNDELAVDIALLNPSSQKIISAETWLNYDSKKLTGVKLDSTGSDFDLITPGENEFAPEQSLVRIGRGNTTGGVDKPSVSVVRVVFKVVSGQKGDTTEIRFNDFQPNELGHTNANVISGGLPFNVLSATPPKPVTLVLNGTPPAVSVNPGNGSGSSSGAGSSSGSSSGSGSAPSGSNTGTGTLYPSASNLPIPQNVRASTFDSSVTLTWDPVQDPRVSSYYIYYTKHKNQYLHRKKVSGTSYTFGGLTQGDRYYFVLTSADQNGFESGYSSEVSITVGQNGSINVSSTLDPEAIASLNQLSQTASSGPAEDLLLILALCALVYPTYRMVQLSVKSGKLSSL